MKYPRTYHLPWSPGATSDDKIQNDLSSFEGKNIILSEKMDGENTTMETVKYHARSEDSNNHPSRNWCKGLWGSIKHEIPADWRICGENLYAKHSIFYDKLPSYFMMFSVWNENNTCLSWDETIEYSQLLGLEPVPVLFRGKFDENMIRNFHKTLDLEKQEGFVMRLSEPFEHEDFSTSVVKWVREKHVTTSEHWTNQPMIKNLLK